jgi:hypothetical protein
MPLVLSDAHRTAAPTHCKLTSLKIKEYGYTKKDKNFRIMVYDATATKFKVIGMATGCTVNLQNNTDPSSHKDIVGAADMPQTVSKSWSYHAIR